MTEQSSFDILKRINEVDMNVIRLKEEIEGTIKSLSKENQNYCNFFTGRSYLSTGREYCLWISWVDVYNIENGYVYCKVAAEMQGWACPYGKDYYVEFPIEIFTDEEKFKEAVKEDIKERELKKKQFEEKMRREYKTYCELRTKYEFRRFDEDSVSEDSKEEYEYYKNLEKKFTDKFYYNHVLKYIDLNVGGKDDE